MANYYSLRDGLITDTSTYGMSISSVEKTTNTTAYTLTTSDSWSVSLSSQTTDVIDSIAVHLSSRAANPVGTLILSISSSTVSPTVVGTYPVSSFTSHNGSNNTVATYPLNWQLLKLSSPFTNSAGRFRLNLKTSNANQLSLMALSTVNGVDYDRMAVLSDAPPLSGRLTLNQTTLSSTSPFPLYEPNSIYFNGSRNIVASPANPPLDLSVTDFTIEGWIYPLNPVNSSYYTWVCNFGGAYGTFYFPQVDGKLRLFLSYTGASWNIHGVNSNYNFGTLNLSAWNHFAACRSGNTVKTFLNGIAGSSVTLAQNLLYRVTDSIGIGGQTNGLEKATGYASNIRIVNTALYDKNFTPPSTPFNLSFGTLFLVNSNLHSLSSYNYYSFEDIHIGSSLEGLTTEARTITADSLIIDNLYVHNQGKLTFPQTRDANVSVKGSVGLQITSDGTLEVGTSANPIPASVTSVVSLVSSQLDVHNGGNLNVYGAYKKPSTYLVNNSTIGQRTFNVVDAVSSTWSVSDTVVFTPNTASPASFDVMTLSSFTNDSTFTTTSNALYAHPSIATINYVPSVYNLTRNVIIGGSTASLRGDVRAIDAAKVNINNTQFINMGKNIPNYYGLFLGTNNSGSMNLSGNAFYGDGAGGSSLYTWTASRSSIGNINISNNIIYRPLAVGMYAVGVSATNLNFSNNYILSGGNGGILIDRLSGDNINFNNNITAGSKAIHSNGVSIVYGTQINRCIATNSSLDGIISYNNANRGILINQLEGNISNIVATYNGNVGVYVDSNVSNLSNTTFTNITASNNRTLGFCVSGNAIDHLSPITLYINNLVANNNLSGGFEGYCITGNLTALELNRNGIYGMKTSIGNYYTTIDGITALMNNVASTSAGIGILSGTNYYPIVIKNANVDGSNKSGISLDSTHFSQFYVYNSSVSGAASDFNITATRNVLEGSYLISNTNVGPLPIGIGITNANYQSDVLKTAGFAFTNMNNASGFNTTYLAAGNRAVDSTLKGNISSTTAPSERLTPQSTSLKLRSGSKFVALDAGQSTRISVYVRKSSTTHGDSATYNGSSPRLILKRNGAMGINSDKLIEQLDTTGNEFLKLSGITQAVTDAGVLEFYVDCDGTTGWINIDNWTAN